MASYLVDLGGSLLPHVVVFVVALLVRRHRPDAFGLLLASSLVGVGRVLFFFLFGFLAPVVAARHGVSTYRSEPYGALTLALAFGSVMVTAIEAMLLAGGIWRLATRHGGRHLRA